MFYYSIFIKLINDNQVHINYLVELSLRTKNLMFQSIKSPNSK